MYEAFYGLRAKPFQLGPDPRFFFNSQGHKRALAYLRYGVRQGEGFIIITGGVGTGKTTLVGTLFKSLEHENVVAAQIVTTQLQEDDLVRVVAAAYGLPYETVNKATLLRNLEVFFRACVEEGKRVLLVVDEAQNLPHRSLEELRMLSNFHVGGRALLQSFLLGQQEFRNTMRSQGFEQLRQRVIAAYHLRPLELGEVKGYVEHRLLTAGWQGDPKFSEQAHERIYEFTGGVPRRINTLCDRLLLFGCLEEIHEIKEDTVAVVTKDIGEEHGWTGNAQPSDQLSYSGNNGYESHANELSAPEPSGHVPASPVRAPEAPAASESRLSAVEHSVEELTAAFREELALMRKALVANRSHEDGSDQD